MNVKGRLRRGYRVFVRGLYYEYPLCCVLRFAWNLALDLPYRSSPSGRGLVTDGKVSVQVRLGQWQADTLDLREDGLPDRLLLNPQRVRAWVPCGVFHICDREDPYLTKRMPMVPLEQWRRSKWTIEDL